LTYLQIINTLTIEFEWDEIKNQINIRKHGLDFKDVSEMFHYPMLVLADTRQDYAEDRWIGIGSLKDTTVVVIFTEPNEKRIRIISARKATRYEKEKYQEEIANQLEKD